MAKKRRKNNKISFISLGCPKNVVDSEKMLAEIAQAGFFITNESDNADVIIINTCGFIEPARIEALEAIQHAVDCKQKGRTQKVIVAGCLSQRLGRQLFNQVEGIDAIVGLSQRDNIAQIIEKTLLTNQPATYLGNLSKNCGDDTGRLLITGRYWAYLRISEGCNHRCSFCTIPEIRGPYRSKSVKLVLAEADELVSSGVVELNIIAQDTTYYGRDIKMTNGLASLIMELEKIENLVWVRLMYLWPAGINEKLIETIAKSKKTVHYLDIPLQHINNEILKAMYRPNTKDKLHKLIEKLRAAIPDIVLRTTMIVGFPGETEEQFTELLDFVKWAKFDALGCFKFYPESGTPAADMPGQVPDEIKQQRVKKLMLTQQIIAFSKNENKIGSPLSVLIDSVDNKGIGRGRYFGQAPEIDSVCIVKNCSAKPGEFVKTQVIGTKDYDLLVNQI
ncbi:MAG: ribosomal protein S12 methylthiotransferase RimO [Planctomycetes bacterium RBG_13_46_10]|nr:MAG: ribosomal protein S12 methylthiotransferase RimO [Planctomycetes bacterium RBG_13_46_10]